LFGEAVLHPEIDSFVREIFQNGLTSFLEIDGATLKDFVESESYKKILDFVPAENRKKIIFAISLDSFSDEKFSALHGGANLQDAISAIKILSSDFCETYAQFTRTTQNEDELENFFRAWSEKSSATGGKIIIQKYDNFCASLPSIKSADLAPVKREPCWHLRRDMEILFDGSVPLCREVCAFEDAEILGNVFESELEEIWQKKNSVLQEHIQKNYGVRCGKCDEYYIFNF
ncbi:MAG: SPASM domain-containing protein, partial [Treponemataceae bacterium]|nr:SPASM domain-containing protein [Treponemataceae bacterium]